MIRNLSVKTKLWFVASVLFIGMIIITVLSISTTNEITSELEARLYDESYKSINLMLSADRDMYQALSDIEIAISNINQSETDEHLSDYSENITQISQRVKDAKEILSSNNVVWAKYIDENTGNSIFDIFSRFDSSFNDWTNAVESSINSDKYTTELNVKFNIARTYIDTISGMIDIAAQDQINESKEDKKTAVIVMIIINAIILVTAFFLILKILNMLTRPLKKLTEAANKLSQGQIDVDVESSTTDELGLLLQAFSIMSHNIKQQALAVERLADGDMTFDIEIKSEDDLLNKKLMEMVKRNRTVIGGIAVASEQVSAGARQISDSGMLLAQGSAEQACSIEELTTSVEEVAYRIKQNATHADEASKLAEAAMNHALKGNTHMLDMLKAMEEINKSSSNISKIIKVIEDIAFQTKILALNASVEAARAGQYGKGFAVVADEVKNLAAKCSEAANKTIDMIDDSMKKTDHGMKIAASTGEALSSILERITEVTNRTVSIASASSDQAAAIEQINTGLVQVSKIVQDNSATAEESSAASQELFGQATFLEDMMGQFKITNKQEATKCSNKLQSEQLKIAENRYDYNINSKFENDERTVIFAPQTRFLTRTSEF